MVMFRIFILGLTHGERTSIVRCASWQGITGIRARFLPRVVVDLPEYFSTRTRDDNN